MPDATSPELSPLHEPFHTRARQREADRLGMLVFLASEAMLFGGLFAAALMLRLLDPAAYAAASGRLSLWLGTLNTAVLLTSSALAALAVTAARHGRPRAAVAMLAGTMALGALFLAIKGYEWSSEAREGLLPVLAPAHFTSRFEQLFMNLYLLATGLHALHVTGGLVLLATAAFKRRTHEDTEAVLIGNAALYWHLVDVIWIFLYPTLYLARVNA